MNYILPELERLSERLEQLGIDDFMWKPIMFELFESITNNSSVPLLEIQPFAVG